MSLFGSILRPTSTQHLCVLNMYIYVNRLVIRSVSLSFDPAMRSMLSANRRDFVPPSDCNSVNEGLNA